MSLKEELAQLKTARSRVLQIVMIWEKAGYVLADRVRRVLEEKYNWYVTFNDAVTKREVSGDGYVVICGASTAEEAIEIAKQTYGGLVDDVLAEWEIDPAMYPKGELAQIGTWDDDKDAVKA